MPAEISVRETAELLQLAERQALWMRHQGGQHTEPGLLMDHTV